MTERLLMIHNHIRNKEDSEYVPSFPFMSDKERHKYMVSGFQSGLKFPLSEGNIVNKISPSMYDILPPKLHYHHHSAYGTRIGTRTKATPVLVGPDIIHRHFIDESQTKLILNIDDEWDVSVLEDNQFDHIIITADQWKETIDDSIGILKLFNPNSIISVSYSESYSEQTEIDTKADIIVVPSLDYTIVSVSSRLIQPNLEEIQGPGQNMKYYRA